MSIFPFSALSAISIGGMFLLMICAYIWARLMRPLAWHGFVSGFFILLLSKLSIDYRSLFRKVDFVHSVPADALFL
ncbi:MAG: hypothetical protein LBS40_03765 [Burkholderiales bacterium]|jgi:hypothetical protein|nr:hypothetical protein [Burkholderiales bacterium]